MSYKGKACPDRFGSNPIDIGVGPLGKNTKKAYTMAALLAYCGNTSVSCSAAVIS